jgi:hypothetical protein
MFKYIYTMPELNSQQQFDNIVNKYLEWYKTYFQN